MVINAIFPLPFLSLFNKNIHYIYILIFFREFKHLSSLVPVKSHWPLRTYRLQHHLSTSTTTIMASHLLPLFNNYQVMMQNPRAVVSASASAVTMLITSWRSSKGMSNTNQRLLYHLHKIQSRLFIHF